MFVQNMAGSPWINNMLALQREFESAERSAREEEAEEILKEIDARRDEAKQYSSTSWAALDRIFNWIRDRHAPKPSPLSQPTSVRAEESIKGYARHAMKPGVNDSAWKESAYQEAKAGLKHVESIKETILGARADGSVFAMVPEARIREIIDEVLTARSEQSKRLVREIVRDELKGAIGDMFEAIGAKARP